MITSLMRSTSLICPSGKSTAASPVRKKPSGIITRAVSSGWVQYPAMTCGPFTHNSPASLHHLLGDGALAIERVGGDDRAVQRQHLQQLWHSGDLIRLSRAREDVRPS